MKQFRSVLPNYIFNGKGAVALFLGGIISAMTVSLLNIFSMFILHQNYQYEAFFLLLSNTVMWLGAIFAFDYFICRPQTGKKLNFNFSGSNFYTYLLIFPMLIGMMFIAEFITGQIPVTGPFFGNMYEAFTKMMQQLSTDPSVMIVMAVLMAPIFEEIVFRGIIQKGLINKGLKPHKAIWISAVVFGLVHGNPWQFVGAVLLGYVLGLVYYKTKSLLLPMLLHGFNNLVGSLMIYYKGSESFGDTFGVSEYVILGAGIILFTLFYYLFINKYRVHYSD